MIFHGNSLHCKGPILEAKFWTERMVVLRSSAPSPWAEILKMVYDADFKQAPFEPLIEKSNFHEFFKRKNSVVRVSSKKP